MPRTNTRRAGWFAAGLLSGLTAVAAFVTWAVNDIANEEAHR